MSRFSVALLACPVTRTTVPDILKMERADLLRRREAIRQLRIGPDAYPPEEEWLRDPVHTSVKMDVHRWRHRNGAEFIERSFFPWMRGIETEYAVSSPGFVPEGVPGCRFVRQLYENCWLEYLFRKFDLAAAFALKTYTLCESLGHGDHTPCPLPEDWGGQSEYDYGVGKDTPEDE